MPWNGCLPLTSTSLTNEMGHTVPSVRRRSVLVSSCNSGDLVHRTDIEEHHPRLGCSSHGLKQGGYRPMWAR
jgi:hypothetical protein